MNQRILNLFRSFLTKEVWVIDQVNSFEGNIYIEQSSLIFSLPALHDYLNRPHKEKISYQKFQRQLYQSTLNQDLKAHGAQVVVHHSTGKVETNLYRLERIESADLSG